MTLINRRFLPFFGRTKAKVNIIKVKTQVKLLSIKLGKGGEDELRVKIRLFSNVESYNI
jgi:hypothetical protein